MKTKTKTRPSPKIKNLSAKNVSGRKAKAVKGGMGGGKHPPIPPGPGPGG